MKNIAPKVLYELCETSDNPLMQDEKRLVDLEIKMAHAEQTIEDLNEGLYKQQLKIEKLEQTINLMSKKLQSGTSGELEIGPANEKPPHY